MSPDPFQVPLAPCQLPDFNLKRLPSASTTYRPSVLSGPRQDAASAAPGLAGVRSDVNSDADEVATNTVPDAAPSSASVTSDDVRNRGIGHLLRNRPCAGLHGLGAGSVAAIRDSDSHSRGS